MKNDHVLRSQMKIRSSASTVSEFVELTFMRSKVLNRSFSIRACWVMNLLRMS